MTEYPTAERTATTPLHVSTTPHLAYLLVLLALLAADILTTVWFTRLGLPELNPFLAPIAGSVAAQVAYKAPFALLLAGGTALLAAGCDRLRPGAGKYPWLAVAGIYAVPVAWNLVVIAGHTGFHVVPAVVYAPVAVVCAVGVWRAARPRPEALTMPANHPNPRPVGPPSTVPPIASPRSGGASVPGRGFGPWLLVALAVLLIAAAVPVVSADEILTDNLYVDISPGIEFYCKGDDQRTGWSYPVNMVRFSPEMAEFDRISPMALAPRSAIGNYNSLLHSDYTTVEFYDTNLAQPIKKGTGEYGYFKYMVGDEEWLNIYVDFGDLEVGNLSVKSGHGMEVLMTTSSTEFVFPKVKVTDYSSQKVLNTYISSQSPYIVSFAADRYSDGIALSPIQDFVTYTTIQNVWKNRLVISDVSTTVKNLTKIEIYRDFDNKQHTSRQIIADIYYTSDQLTDLYTAVTLQNDARPATISIQNPLSSRWFNTTLSSDTTSSVTVYIQNSQTGALLADASLSILAAAGGTETEVVNATLPGGTGTYSLEKADYLKYHASATADGYTLLSPILFGVPENGTTIVLWMSPDAPPDVPVEEGKSTLYGYATTQGSQQPISGATVSLDGYGSTTTSSTGFYLFNNVTPGTYDISASAPLHDALSEPVTVDPAATPYNLALRGHFLLTVTAKDDTSLTNLHNATISLSDGQESTQNPATFTADYGPYTITAAAGGYYPQTQSAYLDKPGTTTATVLLTAKPEPVPPPEMPNYPPHSVRFLCIDEYNRPLQNVTLRAVYQESTNPVDWFTSWLGLSQSVNINSTTLEGTTGLDGSVIFLMVESVQYRMTVTAPAPLNMTQTFDLYPKEDEITIRFVTSDRPDLSTMPTYELTATETDPSSVRLALSYHDTTNATTSLTFNVYDHATGDVIHTQTFGASSFPGTVSPTYTVENTKGAMYRFGFEATNTVHGPISQYKGITLNGDGLLVDLGFEDRTLYQWLAVILLFLFAGAFSGTTVKQGAILVPLFGGGLFWFIGWLPITIGGVISAIGFLGVLVYMRKSEWKVRA